MVDLHTRLRAEQAGPNLQEMAQLLGITEYEARALLQQVRQDQAPASAPPRPATERSASRQALPFPRAEANTLARGLGIAMALMVAGFILLLFFGTARVQVESGPPALPPDMESPTTAVDISDNVPPQPVARGD